MEKRIFVAVLISIAFLWLWAAVAPKLFPDLVKPKTNLTAPKPAAPAPVTPPTETSTAVTTSSATPASKAPATRVAPIPAKPVAATAIEYTTITRPGFTARFANRGAELVSLQLAGYKTKEGTKVELVKARDASRTDFPFAIEARDGALAARLNTALYALDKRDQNGETVLEYRYAGEDGVAATKTFRFSNDYLFNFSVAVSPPIPYRIVIGPGIRTLEPDEKDSQFTITGNGVVQRDDDLKVIRREKASNISFWPAVQFVGIEDNYFLAVLRPEKSGGALLRAADFGGGKDKRREIYAGLNAAPDGVVAGQAFFGPKEVSLLDRYGFEKTLQYGMFGIIARFFLIALVWINSFTHNYGWAIIVLTILIKVALYPLQHKWMMSMRKMQTLQPKMEAIKARYRKHRSDAEQKQKMNAEVMKLYQQEGINPAGGCLPMLIQFPIFVGFYNLLSHAIELRGAEFGLWIHDLSAKDPTYILPILMTVAMFVQQMITPTTADPAQRRMFLIMPIVFGWIFKEFPSGLVLYWLVQNILTIVQQLIMNRYWKDHPAELQTA
ncbi:MAG TPA: membrane protein insertase YidC [Thermoanaerobaculia bacterium]|nr:membrane protein insertase YidC [Thermoanaerobaculia bacterium]